MDQFLGGLENDDAKIKELRSKNEGDIYDESDSILQAVNKNLE